MSQQISGKMESPPVQATSQSAAITTMQSDAEAAFENGVAGTTPASTPAATQTSTPMTTQASTPSVTPAQNAGIPYGEATGTPYTSGFGMPQSGASFPGGESLAGYNAGGAGESVDNRPYLNPNSRPSFRKGVVENTWNNAKGPDGLVRDPNTGEIINWTPGQSRKDVWDMGHIPGQKYHDMYQKYLQGELTPKQFRDWYNNPNNYRPEIPRNNRGHLFE